MTHPTTITARTTSRRTMKTATKAMMVVLPEAHCPQFGTIAVGVKSDIVVGAVCVMCVVCVCRMRNVKFSTELIWHWLRGLYRSNHNSKTIDVSTLKLNSFLINIIITTKNIMCSLLILLW